MVQVVAPMVEMEVVMAVQVAPIVEMEVVVTETGTMKIKASSPMLTIKAKRFFRNRLFVVHVHFLIQN